MIDNFDELVRRCSTRRRKRMIRLSLGIVSALIASVSLIAVFWQYNADTKPPSGIVSKTSSPVPTVQEPLPVPTTSQTVADIPQKAAVQPVPPVPKQTAEPKKRLYVLQLMTGENYDKTAAQIKRVPEAYRSGTAIYLVNGRYALRFIDIFDKASLPRLKQVFSAAGFSPISYAYNDKRVALSEKDREVLENVLPSQRAASETNTTKPQASDTPPPPSPIASSERTALFSVDNTSKTPLQNMIDSYNAAPKYDNALSIAKIYYGKNSYTEAASWAKKANQLNREGEEAWLLFAKSNYASGRKNEAIAALELFMNYKESKAAAELLRSWKQ